MKSLYSLDYLMSSWYFFAASISFFALVYLAFFLLSCFYSSVSGSFCFLVFEFLFYILGAYWFCWTWRRLLLEEILLALFIFFSTQKPFYLLASINQRVLPWPSVSFLTTFCSYQVLIDFWVGDFLQRKNYLSSLFVNWDWSCFLYNQKYFLINYKNTKYQTLINWILLNKF